MHTKVSLSKKMVKPRFASSSKRMSLEEKMKLREYCRGRLYNVEEYFESSYDDFIETVINNYRIPVDINKSVLVERDLFNVTSNVLGEIIPEAGFLEFSPSPAECESKIKSVLLAGLELMNLYKKLEIGDVKRSMYPFDFGDLTLNIQTQVEQLDEFLSEAFLSLVAIHFFLHGFEHLYIDEKRLLDDETSFLEKENNFDPMKAEMVGLNKDLKYIEKLEDVVYLGLFRVDVSEVKTALITKIQNVINEAFKKTISSKFKSILENNKNIYEIVKANLIISVDSIENFIELKTFIEGHDLKDQMETIQTEIKLSRSLNDFQNEFRIRTDSLVAEYLLSLHRVSDLKYLQTEARKRLLETAPKFTADLKKQSDGLFDRMLVVQGEIQKFHSFSELNSASHYYEKTLIINKELQDMQVESAEINRKQGTLDVKETSFEIISQELRNFQKYSQVWEFVAFRWGPVVDRWWRGNFNDLNKFEMLNTLNYANELLKRLSEEFSDNNKMLDIVKNKQLDVDRHQNIYAHIVILKDNAFKDRHWLAFFNEIIENEKAAGSFQYRTLDLKKITLADLMEKHLTSYTSFLKQILTKAKAEAEVEQSIKETKDKVSRIPIKPRTFDTDNVGLSIIPNTVILLATLQEHKAICKNMLSNPDYPEELRRELTNVIRLISFTIEVVKWLQRVQNKLIKFSPLFRYSKLSQYIIQEDFLANYLKLRMEFMEIMRSVIQHEMLYFIQLIGEARDDDTKVEDVIRRLKDMNKHCDEINHALVGFFQEVRRECPRYYFFSDQQMLTMCSLLKFPKSLLGIILNLFKGIDSVQFKNTFVEGVDVDNFSLVQLKTKNSETMRLNPEIYIDMRASANIPIISIITEIERSVEAHILGDRQRHLVYLASLNFDFAKIFIYVKEHNILLQNVRLMLQLVFDYHLMAAYKTASQPNTTINIQEFLAELKQIITRNYCLFFEHPSRFIPNNFTNLISLQYYDSFIMIIKHFENTLDYLQSTEVFEFNCFEFQALPKYSIDIKRTSTNTEESVRNAISWMYKESNQQKGSLPRIIEAFYADSSNTVSLNIMGYSLEHRNELLAISHPMDYFPLYQKTAFYLISSIESSMYVLLKGPAGVGKNSMVRSLAYLTGKNHYEYDCSMNKRISQTASFFAGALSGGFWLTLKNIENCSDNLISVISSIVTTIKDSMPNVAIPLSSIEVIPKKGYCIFCTYRLTSIETDTAGFLQLPVPIRENFRIISLMTPSAVTIFSSIISPVIQAPYSVEWATKLLLFVKTHRTLEFNEEIDTKEDSLSRATSAVSLKSICLVLRASLIKYYGHLHRIYEKFKDQNGKYRLDIDKVKVISQEKDRRAVFTKLVVETFGEYFSRVEIGKEQLRGLTMMLNEIFKEEIEPALHLSVSGAPLGEKKSRDRIYDALREFKENNKTALIPSASKLYSRIESLVFSLLSSDEVGGNHFLVYGKPDSQKSTLLEVLGFVYSELNQINMRKYWLILDALKSDYLFGFDSYEGILTDIFNQCHGLNLEDKNSQPKKINYLFQNGSELFYNLGDNRDPKKLKTTKELSKSHSWIIFDGNTGKNNPHISKTVSSLVSMFNTLYEYKEIDHHIGVSPNLKLFYELSTIGMLDPKIVADLRMIYIDTPLIDLNERAEIWLDGLKSKDRFFGQIRQTLSTLIDQLAIPLIELLVETGKDKTSFFLYTPNGHSMLCCFFSLLEIFLNELRKYWVIHDFETMKEQPGVLSSYKSEANALAAKMGNRPLNIGNPSMRLLQGLNYVARSSRQISNQGQQLNAHYLSGIETVQDIEESEVRNVEAVFLFSFVHSIYPLLFETTQESATRLLEENLHAYTKKKQNSQATLRLWILLAYRAKEESQSYRVLFRLHHGELDEVDKC